MFEISFDPNIKNINFSQVSGSKGSRLGYYHIDNKYIFGFEGNHLNKKFFTRPKDINKIIQGAFFSEEGLKQKDLENTLICIQYVQKIQIIIEKHNNKLDKTKKKFLFRILLVVPLVKKFVSKYFEHLKTSFSLTAPLFSHFYKVSFNSTDSINRKINDYFKVSINSVQMNSEVEKLKNLIKIGKWKSNKELIESEFGTNNQPIVLKKIKNQLLEYINKSQNQFGLVSGELTNLEIWDKTKQEIIEVYEKKLKECLPIIGISENIIENAKANPKTFFEEYFKITENILIFDIDKQFRKNNCSFDVEFMKGFSPDLADKVQQAKEILSSYYYQKWIPSKINLLIKNNELFNIYFNCSGWMNLVNRKTEINSFLDQWINEKSLSECVSQLQDLKKAFDKCWTEKINQMYPSLAFAEKIMRQNLSSGHSNNLYLLFDVAEDDVIDTAVAKVNATMQKLNKTEDLPKEQVTLLEKAKQLVRKGYGQWLVKKVAELEKQAKSENKLGEVLSSQRSHFLKRYKSICDILAENNFKDTLHIITEHYGNFLEKEIESILPLVKNPSLVLNPDSLFNEKTYLKMVERKENLISTVKEWEEFQKIRQQYFGRDVIQIEEVTKKGINLAIDAVLKAQFPIYKKSKDILEIFVRNGENNDIPEDFIVNLKSESWYKKTLLEIEKLEGELSKPSDLPEPVKESINTATKILKKHLAHIETKRIKNISKRGSKKPEGIFNTIGSWLGRVDVRNYLDEYKEYLFDLFDIKSVELIFKRYEELKSILSSLPNSKTELNRVTKAYNDYERSLKLKSILSIIFNNKTPEFTDLFPKVSSADGDNIYEIDRLKSHLLDLIDVEMREQENRDDKNERDKIIKGLIKLRETVIDHFKKYIQIKLPQFSAAEDILEKIKNLKENPKNYRPNSFQIYEALFKISRPLCFKFSFEEMSLNMKNLTNTLKVPEENALSTETLSKLKEAAEWIEIAYKLWEADRILNAQGKGASLLLGLPQDAERATKRRRYMTLQLLLHPDKNGNISEPLRNRMEEAIKLISPDLYA